MGVRTVGDLAQLPEAQLRSCFGRHGESMARRAIGIDNRSVVTEHEVKSVSQERTFARNLRDTDALKGQLWKLSQGVAQRLKKTEIAAATVAIKLRYANFETLTRQMRLALPTDDEREIYRASLVLLKRAWQQERPVRLLGVAARQLSPPTRQLSLRQDGDAEGRTWQSGRFSFSPLQIVRRKQD